MARMTGKGSETGMVQVAAPPSDAPGPIHDDTPQRLRIRSISADLFAKRGYNAVGIAEIGEAVGLARGALYYHIGSKEELLYNIVVRYISDLAISGERVAADVGDPLMRLRVLSRYLMRTISAHINEMTVCFREVEALTGERHAFVSRQHSRYEKIWRQTIADGVAKRTFRPVPGVALKGILGMYFYSFLWLDPEGRHSAEEIADIFCELVVRGVAADLPALTPAFARKAKAKK